MTDFLHTVASYFRAHPGEWVDAHSLQHLGGTFAWRTRVSECRTKLGLTIENRQHRVKTASASYTVSEYRYVPTPEQLRLIA